MSTFSGWLDQCEELISALPTQLEQCDHAHLRELAMKYKVSALASWLGLCNFKTDDHYRCSVCDDLYHSIQAFMI